MATIRIQGPATPKLVISGPTQGLPGPQGPAGPGSAGVIHVQTTPAEIWTISHQLGYKPTVSVYDVDSEEVEAEIVHLSTSEIEIYLSAPLAGHVRLY